MSDLIIIGVDHGYAAMKTAHFSFPTGLVEYEHEPYTQKDVLEYGGKYYVVGSARQPLQRDKTRTEDYYLLTLAAIAKELDYRGMERTAEVLLAAGLPLTSFGRDKKKFRDYLLRGGKPVCFRYEGRDYTVHLADVMLFPQGYAAVLTQTELLDEPSVIVADIGGWTVDLMRLDNRIPNAATCRSLELGMIRCLDEISEKARQMFGVSMTDVQIESMKSTNERDNIVKWSDDRMKIQIENDILSGTAAEIMDQLRGRAFDPTEFPDTESYIWFLQNNVIRTTGLEFPLPEGDVEQQARFIFDRLSKIGALTILEG